MSSPLDFFFKLGDKATGGDPKKQADFLHYMLWILFLAFLYMFTLNVYRLITAYDPEYIIWAMIGFAITAMQYFALKQSHELKRLRNNPTKKEDVEEVIESVDDMINSFKK